VEPGSLPRVLARNVELVLAYDGGGFHGWQEQPGGLRTVQGVLQDAIEKLTGVRACTRGASRTDAGVHAQGQVAAFRTDATIPAEGLRRGLSALLRPDVVVLSCRDAPQDFDPRRDAKGKHYRYRVLATPTPDPLRRRDTWWVAAPLDAPAMQSAAAALVGTHDFSAFRSSSCAQKNPVRTVTRLDLVRHGDEIRFEVEGTAFLMNMVRILVGTLVDVGAGRIPAALVPTILADRDRRHAGRTAPAQGLTLMRVFY
jgi:tRNA pseudouridine38-40 synthase